MAAVLARDAALTVELALQEPVAAEVATVGEGRQHQRGRHTGVSLPPLRWELR